MESVLVVMEINKAIERLPYLTVEKIKFAFEDHLRINSFFISFLQTTFWGLSEIMQTRIFSSRIYWPSSPNGLCSDA